MSLFRRGKKGFLNYSEIVIAIQVDTVEHGIGTEPVQPCEGRESSRIESKLEDSSKDRLFVHVHSEQIKI